jgi:hypothetical protein
MRGQLSVAWGQFLSQFVWDWFLSLTFREDVKSFRAHRLFGYFVRDLEKDAGIPIFWFRADEIGPQGGRFHLHALIGNVAHLRRMTWVDRWNRLAGYARILPFNERKGAAYYCAKYVTKQNGDWELSNNLLAFKQYQPVLPLTGPTKPAPLQSVTIAKTESSQLPNSRMPHGPQYLFLSEANIEKEISDPAFDVYVSEVTRGKRRFQQFCFPSDVRKPG